MAWNQPNNGSGNQPNNSQRPPEIDDFLKKVNKSFERWFGGNGSGNADMTPLKIGAAVVVGLIVVTGFYKVEQAEEAVVLRFGKYNSTQMITEDTNIVEINLTVQYRIAEPVDYLLKVSEPEVTLLHATESALRHVVGGSKMGQVLNEGRATLARDIKPRLQGYLDGYKTGLEITGVNILEALPPKEVKAAFDDVIRAKEDKERLKNQAETYANGIVPEARGQAARVTAEANAYKQEVVDIALGDAARFNQLVVEYKKSPQVIRQRLYLETMEGVLSKTSKVIIEGNGGNMVYLPLDKIIENSNSTNVTRATPNDMSDTANQRATGRQGRGEGR